MSLPKKWKAAQERGHQRQEAEEAGHRRYAKAWELHKLGISVMTHNGGPDPAFTEEVLDSMLAAEKGRRTKLYETFARARTVTIFQALGVQVLAGDDTVYTIGNHDPLTETNCSRPLGLIAGARAMVPDGSPAWPSGHVTVVFPDGTVHTHMLNGNEEAGEAQKEGMRFNALAGATASETTKIGNDPAVRLQKLQELREAGLLSQEEYDAKRAEVIKAI